MLLINRARVRAHRHTHKYMRADIELKAQTLNVDLDGSNLSPLLRGGGDG